MAFEDGFAVIEDDAGEGNYLAAEGFLVLERVVGGSVEARGIN